MKVNIITDTITPQLRLLQRAIDTSGRRRVLIAVAQRFVDMTKQNFGNSGTYRGNTWPNLSIKYAKKVGHSNATLIQTGNLKQSIQASAPRGNWVEITSKTPYSAAHLLGNKRTPQRIYFPMEMVSANMWRPVLSAEKELQYEFIRTLFILSGGGFPLFNPVVARQVPMYGNVTLPAQESF